MSFHLYDLPGHDEPQRLSDEQVELMAEKPKLHEPKTQEEAVRAAALNPDFDPIHELDETGGAYRPEDHTVAEVLEYVGQDAAAAASVRSLEEARGDKARSTLVGALTAIADPA